MRLGFLPALEASGGGIYQYSLAMLDAVEARATEEPRPIVFTSDPAHPSAVMLDRRGWDVRPLDPSRLGLFRSTVRRRAPPWVTSSRMVERLSVRAHQARIPKWAGDGNGISHRPDLGRYIRRCGVDLMVYPAPNVLSFESGVPYVMAIHDLQHRLQPHFPEVSAGGEWESREYLFRNGTEHATLILADSEIGREDILSLYAIQEDRVRVVPFPPPRTRTVAPADLARVRSRYNLPLRYGFYPAQFWPHKNHARIVRAVGEANAAGVPVSVVFAGSHGGQLRTQCRAEVIRLVEELDLARNVLFLGYVDEEDIPALYAGARALVMPTFFGPTNIPILEAWQLECAVISSNIRGIREQVGDAGFLVDPNSVPELADALVQLWTDEPLHSQLVRRGAARVAAYGFDDFAKLIRSTLSEAQARLAG